MAIRMEGGTFEDVGTIYRGPDHIDIIISNPKMTRVGTVFDIQNSSTQMVTSLQVPPGVTHDEVLQLIDASKKALTEGHDPVSAISKSKVWERWAGLGADLVTIATPIVQFAMTLMPK